MIKVKDLTSSGRLPKTYAELVTIHLPRPISDKVSYENTVEIVDALAGHTLNRDQSDYLEILSDLIESWEEKTLPPLPKVTGVEILRYLMEENGMTGDDLAALLNVDRSVAYKILKGSRNLTTDHIRRLSDRFAVRADLFI